MEARLFLVLKLFTATRFVPFANGAYDFQRMAGTKGSANRHSRRVFKVSTAVDVMHLQYLLLITYRARQLGRTAELFCQVLYYENRL